MQFKAIIKVLAIILSYSQLFAQNNELYVFPKEQTINKTEYAKNFYAIVLDNTIHFKWINESNKKPDLFEIHKISCNDTIKLNISINNFSSYMISAVAPFENKNDIFVLLTK